jgi:uncharacterized protein (UPF0335 family)
MPDANPSPVDETPAKIRTYADRLVAQKERMKDESEQYAAILANAVADGLDKKAMQELVKRLMSDEKTVRNQVELIELYEQAYKAGAGV